MKNMWKKGVLALATGATLVAMAAPAEARGYYGRGGYGHYHRGGGNTGAAVAGGIIGLALGAAIASSANRDRGGYYERGYSRPYRDAYYDDGYYERPRVEHYRSYRTCTTDRYWDDYRGGWTTVQRCD